MTGLMIRLRQRFDRSLATFLAERAAEYTDDSIRRMLARINRLVLADGKRVRPLFCRDNRR